MAISRLGNQNVAEEPPVAAIYSPGVVEEKKGDDLEAGVDAMKVEVERSMDAAPTFPEGGRRAWLTVVGAFLIQYTCFGYLNSFGVYQDYYIRVYMTQFSPSDIGWIGGVQMFLNFSLGAITGRIFDRGYFVYLNVASVFLHAISLFMLSLSHSGSYYQVLLSHGIAFGLASGLSYVPSLSIAGHYFQRRRALAVGIISSGSALGAVVHPIMLNKLFNGPVGFKNGVRISAALNTFLLIIAAFITRTRLPPKEVQHFPVIRWLHEPAYLSFIISGIFMFLGLFFPVFYLQLDAFTHGIDATFAFYAVSVLNAASIFGRIVPNYLAPRLGVFNLGALTTICAGIVVLCMIVMKDEAGTIVFAIFFGFFSGASIALVPAMIAHLAKDANEIGTRLGLVFGIGGVLCLFGTFIPIAIISQATRLLIPQAIASPISGALLTSDYHWIPPIVFAGVTVILGGMFYGISGRFYVKGMLDRR